MLYHLTNCHIVDSEKNFFDDLLIKNGKIKRIGKDKIEQYLYEYKQKYHIPGFHPRDNEQVEKIDLNRKMVMPSFVDLHFHLRNPGQEHKESLETGNTAAIKGGYTHILAMANTKPVIDSKELVEQMMNANAMLNQCELYQASAVTKGLLGQQMVDFKNIRHLTRFFSDDGRNIDDAEIMEKALRFSKELDFVILDHSEEETEMVRRNVTLAKKTGGNLHLCHVSKKASMQEIIRAKEEGACNITVEVTPHHLFADGLDYKVNPPFAQKEDREFLIWATQEGYVDAIATDHAPHTLEDKQKGAPGISGIETSLGLVYEVFMKNDMSMQQMSRLMSFQPMRFLGEQERSMQEGMPADLVVIEEGRFVIDTAEFLSKGKNTPFEGKPVHARAWMTMKAGKILYRRECSK